MYDNVVAPRAWGTLINTFLTDRKNQVGVFVVVTSGSSRVNVNKWTATQTAAERSKKRAVDRAAKKAHPIIDYNKRTCAVIPKYTSRFIVSTRSAEPILLARPTVAARERDEKRGIERER